MEKKRNGKVLKVFLLCLAFLILGIGIGAGATAAFFMHGMEHMKDHPEEWCDHMAEGAASRAKLDSDEKTQFSEALSKWYDRMLVVRAQIDPDLRKEKDKLLDELREFLTEEQIRMTDVERFLSFAAFPPYSRERIEKAITELEPD